MTRDEKIEALKRKGVYYKWKLNCRSKRLHPNISSEERGSRTERFLDDEGYSTHHIVRVGFKWANSREGFTFWRNIADELEKEEK